MEDAPEHPFYVPFEPGPCRAGTLLPRHAAARSVACIPHVGRIGAPEAEDWFSQPQIEGLRDLRTRRVSEPATRVCVMCDPRFLFVAVDCAEPRMDLTRRIVPPDAPKGLLHLAPKLPGLVPRSMKYDENVSVQLDALHDKCSYISLSVSIRGTRQDSRQIARSNWGVFPDKEWLPSKDIVWHSAVAVHENGWRAALAIDLGRLNVDPRRAPTLGFNVLRTRNVGALRHSSWCDATHSEQIHALEMGDLYLGGHGVRVRRIDWDELEIGPNRLRVTVDGDERSRDVRLLLRVVDAGEERLGEHAEQTGSEVARLPATGSVPLEGHFSVPFDRISLALRLSVIDAGSGEALYRAVYPLHRQFGLRIGRPFRLALQAAPDPPPPDAPDFQARKVASILSKLPRFQRLTTAQGAPSDFTLASEDGGTVFDLMKAGALGRIADWLCGLFESDDDRLCALTLFANDEWVCSPTAQRCPMQLHLTPLSLLRLGGSHGYAHAAIAAGIANAMPDPATGSRHEAWVTLVLGHVITMVRRGDGEVPLDPSYGFFFFDADNRNLATMRELAANPKLVSRVHKSRALMEQFLHPEAHSHLPEGTVVWPTGAPPE